jgi:alpha-beta hydrolase superfamily lysophospholipase
VAAKEGMPLLLINGKADLLVNPQAVVDFAVTPFFTNAEVHHLDGIGHSTFYEAEKDVAGFILEFVPRVSLARRDEEAL